MLESLVLLADLLCVPYTVVFTPSDKTNKMDKGEEVMRELEPAQREKFEKFFKQDIKGVVVETIWHPNKALTHRNFHFSVLPLMLYVSKATNFPRSTYKVT